MKYNFTIIIPHKNIPILLQRCLDSIPHREDLQIIVVDDNSDPNKVDFSHFPGLDRPDCKVIFTKEGKGAGYARNVALREVDSKWVLFADADDFYSENLNEFLDKYKDSNFQTVYFYNDTVDTESLQPIDKDKFVENLVHEGEKLHNMDCLRYKAYAPWTKMTQLSLIKQHDIWFEEIPAANDSLFNVKVGHYAEFFDIFRKKVYIRTIRKGSLFYSFEGKLLLSRLKCGYHVNTFLKECGKDKLKNYHSETWGHFCDLRKISWCLFLRTVPEYFLRTPWFIIRKHIYSYIK